VVRKGDLPILQSPAAVSTCCCIRGAVIYSISTCHHVTIWPQLTAAACVQVVVLRKRDFLDLDNPLLAWMLDYDAVSAVLKALPAFKKLKQEQMEHIFDRCGAFQLNKYLIKKYINRHSNQQVNEFNVWCVLVQQLLDLSSE
jgi:hypothetical protein